ncbi:hypothetical protein IGI04_011166 [Brassica rapa subsp. trilocularis]|uniref:Uncharacterized protein n=1 Tax=Brassica rapa subsp. trilocularis TaxID=1813537 RepID=A0ABQ7N295_BRACM|nr:hypothetical protein IGI04_011166 [Brassica rapa subsp. trilocularis]
MSVTCLARKMASRREKKKVKGNGPNKDSAHEVHRLLETKPIIFSDRDQNPIHVLNSPKVLKKKKNGIKPAIFSCASRESNPGQYRGRVL